MANNATTAVSGANYLVPNVNPRQAIDGVFNATPLISAFRARGRFLPTGGSQTLEWNYVVGTDLAASAWTENESITSFGSTLTPRASQVVSFGKAPYGVTDRQLANQANGGTYEDVLAREERSATLKLMKYFEDLFCGNGASVGISALIDSTGTAHGINQSTYAGWASVENTCSGSSFVSVLDDTYSDLLATNASIGDIVVFMSPAVFTIYEGAVASNMRGMYGQSLDLGKAPVGQPVKFNGMPIVVIPGASATECYFVDMSKAKIAVHIEPTSKDVPATNLGVNRAVVGAMALILEDRAVHAKITQIDLRTA